MTEPITKFDWGEIYWLANAELGNSRELSLARMFIYPGASNDNHRHPNCEESIYLVRGQVRHQVGAQNINQQVGSAVIVPRDTPHRSTNVGTGAVELILAYSSEARAFVLEK